MPKNNLLTVYFKLEKQDYDSLLQLKGWHRLNGRDHAHRAVIADAINFRLSVIKAEKLHKDKTNAEEKTDNQ